MTTALIAEDEPILAQALAAALARLWPDLQLRFAVNGAEALALALQEKPDVLFLDIRMPGKTGLQVAAELAEEWPQDSPATPFPLLAFVTAYDEYAVQAFEQAAVDYVLKPVSDARLQKTVQRLQEALTKRQAGPEGMERVLAQLRLLAAAPAAAQAPRLQVIRAGMGREVRMIPLTDVLYFEADDKYIKVVSRKGENLVRMSLRELLPQLDPQQFWQVHRACVVNIACVEAAERDDAGKLELRLTDHPRLLPVSRVYAHLFRQM